MCQEGRIDARLANKCLKVLIECHINRRHRDARLLREGHSRATTMRIVPGGTTLLPARAASSEMWCSVSYSRVTVHLAGADPGYVAVPVIAPLLARGATREKLGTGAPRDASPNPAVCHQWTGVCSYPGSGIAETTRCRAGSLLPRAARSAADYSRLSPS